MIAIKPVTAGFPQTEATKIMIRPIINSTVDTTCNTYWELQDEEGQVLATGNTPIEESEYRLWDSYNESLENIVLQKLGLERAATTKK